MNRNSLQKLIDVARKNYAPPKVAPEEAPLGFASRVAAHWARPVRQSHWAPLFERVGWWGVATSTAVCLFAVIHRATLPEPNPFELFLETELAAPALL